MSKVEKEDSVIPRISTQQSATYLGSFLLIFFLLLMLKLPVFTVYANYLLLVFSIVVLIYYNMEVFSLKISRRSPVASAFVSLSVLLTILYLIDTEFNLSQIPPFSVWWIFGLLISGILIELLLLDKLLSSFIRNIPQLIRGIYHVFIFVFKLMGRFFKRLYYFIKKLGNLLARWIKNADGVFLFIGFVSLVEVFILPTSTNYYSLIKLGLVIISGFFLTISKYSPLFFFLNWIYAIIFRAIEKRRYFDMLSNVFFGLYLLLLAIDILNLFVHLFTGWYVFFAVIFTIEFWILSEPNRRTMHNAFFRYIARSPVKIAKHLYKFTYNLLKLIVENILLLTAWLVSLVAAVFGVISILSESVATRIFGTQFDQQSRIVVGVGLIIFAIVLSREVYTRNRRSQK